MYLYLKLRQEDYEFQVTQGYTVRSFLKRTNQTSNNDIIIINNNNKYPAYYLNFSQGITLRKAKWVLYGHRVPKGPILLEWLMRKIPQKKV